MPVTVNASLVIPDVVTDVGVVRPTAAICLTIEGTGVEARATVASDDALVQWRLPDGATVTGRSLSTTWPTAATRQVFLMVTPWADLTALAVGPHAGGTVVVLTGVTVVPAEVDLAPGMTIALQAVATYSSGATVDCTATAAWASSDPTVLSVVGGVVTAHAAGTATITATLANGMGVAAGTVAVVNPQAVVSNSAQGPATATAPAAQTCLCFIHHSVGSNWLGDLLPGTNYGALGAALQAANYWPSETDYDWSAPYHPAIGSSTDIGQLWYWLCDTRTNDPNGLTTRDNIMAGVYANTNKQSSPAWARSAQPATVNNEIVVIKPCYNNSVVRAESAAGTIATVRRRPMTALGHTVANLKVLYGEYLAYCQAHPERCFVFVTAPPMLERSQTYTLGDGSSYTGPTADDAGRARSLANWLVGVDPADSWLDAAGWVNKNVYVFDLFAVLTHANGHHRVVNVAIEHAVVPGGGDFSAYPTSAVAPLDNHPNAAGMAKATTEFVPLLNAFVRRWQAWRAA